MDVFEEIILPIIQPVTIVVDVVTEMLIGTREATQADYALCGP